MIMLLDGVPNCPPSVFLIVNSELIGALIIFINIFITRNGFQEMILGTDLGFCWGGDLTPSFGFCNFVITWLFMLMQRN
jgi:hypothetical protein